MTEPTRHAPMIAYIGNLYWCTCNEPDCPQGADVSLDDWLARQRFFEPEEYAAHVIATAEGAS